MGALLVLGLALATSARAMGAADDPRTSEVLEAVQGDLKDVSEKTRYQIAYADLNGDRKGEAILYWIDPENWCGSGGCPVIVMTPAKAGWRKVAQTSVSRTPIWILPSRHHGWKDLGISFSGGGDAGGIGVMRFNGRKYPGNPTSAPAIRQVPAGAVELISDKDGAGTPIGC